MKTLRQWLVDNKDNPLGTCILNIRQLGDLSRGEVDDLHNFLWSKHQEIARMFEVK